MKMWLFPLILALQGLILQWVVGMVIPLFGGILGSESHVSRKIDFGDFRERSVRCGAYVVPFDVQPAGISIPVPPWYIL